MFTFIATLALLLALLPLLPLTLAAPVVHLAPLRRALDIGGRHANGNYIVSFKDPNNRGKWLNKVLAAHNVTLDYNTTQTLNGIAGTFSTEALDVLRKQPEVAYIEEGPSLSHDSHELTNESHSSLQMHIFMHPTPVLGDGNLPP
jgi:hypothetical protein